MVPRARKLKARGRTTMAAIRKIKTPDGPRFEYTLQVPRRPGGRSKYAQERRRYESRVEAEAALDARKLELREARIAGITSKAFGDVVEEYIAFARGRGKRTVNEDARILKGSLIPFFGKDTAVSAIDARRIV